jgi:uncharacterized protein (UPF0261 family)
MNIVISRLVGTLAGPLARLCRVLLEQGTPTVGRGHRAKVQRAAAAGEQLGAALVVTTTPCPRAVGLTCGLGLDIARRTAIAAGGLLTISRSPAGGARVTMTFGLAD